MVRTLRTALPYALCAVVALLATPGCDGSGGGGGTPDGDADADSDADTDADTDSDTDSTTSTGIVCDDETCHDGATGRTWQVLPLGQTLSWDEAMTHCNGLDLAGYTDWRLPSISELGALIKGCDQQSCDENRGPGENGCYWKRNTWLGTCGAYWSATELGTSYPDEVWYANYLFGGKFHDTRDRVGVYVRCVRGG